MADIKEVLDNYKTAPFDARFPNQNQTKNCWQNYVDFHRCQKIKGEDFEPCEYFRRVYKSLCPIAWVDNWDTQREEGSFASKIWCDQSWNSEWLYIASNVYILLHCWARHLFTHSTWTASNITQDMLSLKFWNLKKEMKNPSYCGRKLQNSMYRES